MEPQMLINYLIDKIVLFDDRMEIYYTSPLTKSPDDGQGLCFEKTVRVLQNEVHLVELFV